MVLLVRKIWNKFSISWASRRNSENAERPSMSTDAPMDHTIENMKTPFIQDFKFFFTLSLSKVLTIQIKWYFKKYMEMIGCDEDFPPQMPPESSLPQIRRTPHIRFFRWQKRQGLVLIIICWNIWGGNVWWGLLEGISGQNNMKYFIYTCNTDKLCILITGWRFEFDL